MQGRRISLDTHRASMEPGDYLLKYRDGEISQLIACLPRTGQVGVIPAEGHGHICDGVREPEWTIVENPSGTVTVMPSIDEGEGGYHGYLTDGIWSDG
jgi:hypothetical protein